MSAIQDSLILFVVGFDDGVWVGSLCGLLLELAFHHGPFYQKLMSFGLRF